MIMACFLLAAVAMSIWLMFGIEIKTVLFCRWKACLRRRAYVASKYQQFKAHVIAKRRAARLRAARLAEERRKKRMQEEAERMGQRYGYDTRKFALRMHRPARILHHNPNDIESGFAPPGLADIPITVCASHRCCGELCLSDALRGVVVFGLQLTFTVKVPRTKPPPPEPDINELDGDSDEGIVADGVAADMGGIRSL